MASHDYMLLWSSVWSHQTVDLLKTEIRLKLAGVAAGDLTSSVRDQQHSLSVMLFREKAVFLTITSAHWRD
jgi:hypothetical protein